MNNKNKHPRYSRKQVFKVRLKQLATTFFVVVTTTLMIQNVWCPVSFSSFQKTWRAGTGAIIFLMGFAVARALFDMYGELVRQIKQGTAGQCANQEGTLSGGAAPRETAPEESPDSNGNIAEEPETEYEPKAESRPE